MWELKKWLSNSFSFQCHPNLVWSPHNSAAALAACAWKNPVSAYSCVSLDLKTEASIFLHVWFPTPLLRGSLGLDRLKLNQSPTKPTNVWQKAITSNSEATFNTSSLHQCQSVTDPRKDSENLETLVPEVLQREHLSFGSISTYHLSYWPFFGLKLNFLCWNVEINECNSFGFEFNFEWIAILKPAVFWDVLKKLFMRSWWMNWFLNILVSDFASFIVTTEHLWKQTRQVVEN